jgi:hypothetical protein
MINGEEQPPNQNASERFRLNVTLAKRFPGPGRDSRIFSNWIRNRDDGSVSHIRAFGSLSAL